jgi:hypothetical protein
LSSAASSGCDWLLLNNPNSRLKSNAVFISERVCTPKNWVEATLGAPLGWQAVLRFEWFGNATEATLRDLGHRLPTQCTWVLPMFRVLVHTPQTVQVMSMWGPDLNDGTEL